MKISAGDSRNGMTLDVAEQARVRKLRPQEKDFKSHKGYWKKPKMVWDSALNKAVPDPSGAYNWGVRYKTNEHGKTTREGAEMAERLRPWQKADVERYHKSQGTIARAQLKDKDGQRVTVDAALADETARRRGLSHAWKAQGNRVERGAEGMLWRWVAGAWQPLGVRCLGTPLDGADREVRPRGIQHDPDAHPWRAVERKWVRLD